MRRDSVCLAGPDARSRAPAKQLLFPDDADVGLALPPVIEGLDALFSLATGRFRATRSGLPPMGRVVPQRHRIRSCGAARRVRFAAATSSLTSLIYVAGSAPPPAASRPLRVTVSHRLRQAGAAYCPHDRRRLYARGAVEC